MKYLLLLALVLTLVGCATDRTDEVSMKLGDLNKRFPPKSDPNALRHFVKELGGGCSTVGDVLTMLNIKGEESKRDDLDCAIVVKTGFCAKTSHTIYVHVGNGVIESIKESSRSSYC
jgi:hypothetical protein